MAANGHRGSALLLALWIIAVLSVMVLSFACEAHLQTGINVYVRERNRVNRLVDAGQVLGEIVMLGYNDVKEPELKGGEPDWEEIFEEEDRWCKEKYELKTTSKCKIGPILLDEENPDSGTVTVEISLSNAGEKNGINVNELYSGGDQNYALRWQMILQSAGLNQELEVMVPKEGRDSKKMNLMNVLIASWNDWRDEDDTVSRSPLEDGKDEDGAESAWYEEQDEDNKTDEEDRRRPRNGIIPDVQELAYIKGFRDYPAVLTGGLLNPDEDESEEENPRLKGIIGVFGVTGSTKINVNDCTVDQLLTVPGIYDEEAAEDGDFTESREVAQAIVDTLRVKPDYDVDETRDWWPYKDWNDLTQRVADNSDVEIGNEANQYLAYGPDENTVFKMKITGESSGMRHSVSCECYVNTKDKKVRYIKWEEDPKE